MHKKEIITAGTPLAEAKKVLIMMHGRGASAEDILSLADYLHVGEFAIIAPQATNHTWYPYPFLEPPARNEPWLSSALLLLAGIVNDVSRVILKENIFFSGFSQGACLTLEFITRNADRYGGVAAFTGGLIGDRIYNENYKGDFMSTPIFIGTSDPDPHVPVSRVNETETILTGMHASVTKKIYANMGHTIVKDELDTVNALLFN